MSNTQGNDFVTKQSKRTAEILKKNREDKDITIAEMAKATGLSERMLERYEAGLYNPNPNKMMMIVYYLGLQKSIDGNVTGGNI